MASFLILLNLGHHGWLSAMGPGPPSFGDLRFLRYERQLLPNSARSCCKGLPMEVQFTPEKEARLGQMARTLPSHRCIMRERPWIRRKLGCRRSTRGLCPRTPRI
jgi:hypothetical protein